MQFRPSRFIQFQESEVSTVTDAFASVVSRTMEVSPGPSCGPVPVVLGP